MQTENKKAKDFATVDHRNPLCFGGTHRPNNIVLACNGCNNEKGGMTEHQYKNWVAAGRPDRKVFLQQCL